MRRVLPCCRWPMSATLRISVTLSVKSARYLQCGRDVSGPSALCKRHNTACIYLIRLRSDTACRKRTTARSLFKPHCYPNPVAKQPIGPHGVDEERVGDGAHQAVSLLPPLHLPEPDCLEPGHNKPAAKEPLHAAATENQGQHPYSLL